MSFSAWRRARIGKNLPAVISSCKGLLKYVSIGRFKSGLHGVELCSLIKMYFKMQ